jgi:hypothetical protein
MEEVLLTKYWIVEKDLDKLYIKSSSGKTMEFDGCSNLKKISDTLYEIVLLMKQVKQGEERYPPYFFQYEYPERITDIRILLDNRTGFAYIIEPIYGLIYKFTKYNQSLISSDTFVGTYSKSQPKKICSNKDFHVYCDDSLRVYKIAYRIKDQINVCEVNTNDDSSKIVATFEGVDEWERLYETVGKCKILSSFFILTIKNKKVIFNIHSLKSMEIDYKKAIPSAFSFNSENRYTKEFVFVRIKSHFLCVDDKIYDENLNIFLCYCDLIREDATIIDTAAHMIAIQAKNGKLYFVEVDNEHVQTPRYRTISYTCSYNSNNEPIASCDFYSLRNEGFYFNIALKKFLPEETTKNNSLMI